MKTATGNAVLRAYSKAAKNVARDPKAASSAVSAGFIIPNGQKRGNRLGFQVFVTAIRFSEDLLRREPTTGGLSGF